MDFRQTKTWYSWRSVFKIASTVKDLQLISNPEAYIVSLLSLITSDNWQLDNHKKFSCIVVESNNNFFIHENMSKVSSIRILWGLH